MADFTFDKSVQRYRGSDGRFLSQSTMLDLTQKAIDLAKTDVGTITDLFVDGKIALAEWTRGIALALKNAHLQSYMLGRGGQKMMNQADYDQVAAKLKTDFNYLDGFAQDIKSGMSKDQLRARVQLYLNNVRSSYEDGQRQGHQAAGYQWESRQLNGTNNCDPCIGYAAMDWVAIGTLPGIGSACDCRANCKCIFLYRKDQPTNSNSILKGFGWLGNPTKPWAFDRFLHG